MKPVEWKTYRTRFLVKAKQLNSSLSFIDPLGRQHCGRKGDYLVESYDGVISIAPRQIFEDIYVSMSDDIPTPELTSAQDGAAQEKDLLRLDHLAMEALKVERIKDDRFRPRFDGPRQSDPNSIPRARRKSPQPVHSVSSRASLM